MAKLSHLFNSVHFSALLLIMLTLVSTWLAQTSMQTSILALLVTASVIIKGQQIVDIFMELYQAPSQWRWFLMSYVILIPITLTLIIYL